MMLSSSKKVISSVMPMKEASNTVVLVRRTLNPAPMVAGINTAERLLNHHPIPLSPIIIDDVGGDVSVKLVLSDDKAGTLITKSSNAVVSSFDKGVWKASGIIADVNIVLSHVFFTPAEGFSSNFSIQVDVVTAGSSLTGVKLVTHAWKSQVWEQTFIENAQGFSGEVIGHSNFFNRDVTKEQLIVAADAQAGLVVKTAFINGERSYTSEQGVHFEFEYSGSTSNKGSIWLGLVDDSGAKAIASGVRLKGNEVWAFARSAKSHASAIKLESRYVEDSRYIVEIDIVADEVTICSYRKDQSLGDLGRSRAQSVSQTVEGLTQVKSMIEVRGARVLNGSVEYRVDRIEERSHTLSLPVVEGVNDGDFFCDGRVMTISPICIVGTGHSNLQVTLTLSDNMAGDIDCLAEAAAVSIRRYQGVLQVYGDVASVNAALSGLIFSAAEAYKKNFSLKVSVSDGVNLVHQHKQISYISNGGWKQDFSADAVGFSGAFIHDLSPYFQHKQAAQALDIRNPLCKAGPHESAAIIGKRAYSTEQAVSIKYEYSGNSLRGSNLWLGIVDDSDPANLIEAGVHLSGHRVVMFVEGVHLSGGEIKFVNKRDSSCIYITEIETLGDVVTIYNYVRDDSREDLGKLLASTETRKLDGLKQVKSMLKTSETKRAAAAESAFHLHRVEECTVLPVCNTVTEVVDQGLSEQVGSHLTAMSSLTALAAPLINDISLIMPTDPIPFSIARNTPHSEMESAENVMAELGESKRHIALAIEKKKVSELL